jgi:hypothetical protein
MLVALPPPHTHTEDFSRAGYFTVEAEAPNPRLYAFEGAITRWDIPPSLGLGIRTGARGRAMAGAAPGRPRQGAGVGPDGTIGTYTAPFNEQVGAGCVCRGVGGGGCGVCQRGGWSGRQRRYLHSPLQRVALGVCRGREGRCLCVCL